MAGATHLVKRFFGSLLPVGPKRADAQWATEQLLDTERELWGRMSRQDQRHAAGVARRVSGALGSEATRPVLAAALLHDVGKVDSRLGTFGRVAATLCGKLAGMDMAELWRSKSGFTRRVGLYLQHDELGAQALEFAGSDPLTIAWAREHHRPVTEWTVPAAVGRALKECDDD
jgi:hypothetical protein